MTAETISLRQCRGLASPPTIPSLGSRQLSRPQLNVLRLVVVRLPLLPLLLLLLLLLLP